MKEGKTETDKQKRKQVKQQTKQTQKIISRRKLKQLGEREEEDTELHPKHDKSNLFLQNLVALGIIIMMKIYKAYISASEDAQGVITIIITPCSLGHYNIP